MATTNLGNFGYTTYLDTPRGHVRINVEQNLTYDPANNRPTLETIELQAVMLGNGEESGDEGEM